MLAIQECKIFKKVKKWKINRKKKATDILMLTQPNKNNTGLSSKAATLLNSLTYTHEH